MSPCAAWATESRLKVGQIGVGHAHAAGKYETVSRLSDFYDVVGIAEIDTKMRSAAAQSSPYSNANWMSEEELLARDDIDLILVETAIDRLLPIARRCLEHNKHIHLDKPAGANLSEFHEVLNLAQSKKLQLQMGYMFRSNPAFQFLFNAVEAGWLGDVFEVHAVISKQVGNLERQILAKYPGGSMFELGCHLIDAVVKLLGKPDRILPINKRTHLDDDLHDNCLAVFEYPRASATVRSSVVEVEGGRRRQFVVCGTRGTISILPLEPPQLTLTLDAPRENYAKGTHSISLPPMTGRYDGDLIDLALAIQGTRAYPYSYAHDLTVQQCILQASNMPLQ